MKTRVMTLEKQSNKLRTSLHTSGAGDKKQQPVSPFDRTSRFRKGFALPVPRAGATLIELTVVVLLLGIVAAIAQPRFSRALNAYRLDAAAERVRSDLEYARALARVRSQITTIHFSTGDAPSGGYYRFERVPAPEQAASVFDADDPNTWYRVELTQEPYRVELRSAPERIVFDLYGRPTDAAVVEVALGERSREIRVVAGSGEVVVE